MELPKEYTNVMITYKGYVRQGPYGDKVEAVVTRRAFYGNTDGYYNHQNEWVKTPNGSFGVPQYWRDWTFSNGITALMPHGFNNYGNVEPKDIIKWEYDTPKQPLS